MKSKEILPEMNRIDNEWFAIDFKEDENSRISNYQLWLKQYHSALIHCENELEEIELGIIDLNCILPSLK